MKVTIKDVAKEANVAPSTVSRVLANSNKISEKTKVRVNEAIKKLNYTPNVVARSLANNKTRILSVILPEGAEELFSNPFFIQAMKGISIYAQKENYYIMYTFKDKKNDDETWIKKFTESNLVDGFILFNAQDNDITINYLKEKDLPFVIIGRHEKINELIWVDNDNIKAMYELTKVLIQYGHKKIAFIGAKENLNVSKDRLTGYKKALEYYRLNISNNLIVEMNEFTELQGYIAAKNLLKTNEISAIITTEDLLAIGAQDALIELERKDVSLVGFNNIPLLQYRNPPIASVDINSEKLGYYATKLLIDKLERRDNNGFYIIETQLIKRDSLKSIK